ncbi:Cyclin-dependent protein kinase regulator pho80 protein [Apiospora rasikravindrae]|uniref:Cyclin-dependent protein kinase regulator pho80 protein n=1 Tax=Apiospora rasikravindrae TaxID=990691 RepID=A0ABR1UBK3_9PEZI
MRRFLGVLAFATRIAMSLAHDENPAQADSPVALTAVTPAIHTISVGAAGFSFRPDSITANVGDTVRELTLHLSVCNHQVVREGFLNVMVATGFNFYPTNYSVARAEFKYPCTSYETVEIGRRGFYSDFMPVQAILNEPPHFDVKINDTEPIFFYCTVPGSCLENSMVGVINPNETFTLDIQKQYVRNSTFEFAPGQPFPTEMPRPNPTGSQYRGGHHDDSMSGAIIAGIAVGGAALLGLIAGLLFLCCGQRFSRMVRQHRGHIALRSAPSPAPIPAEVPARPPRSPYRGSEGLLFACRGEQAPSSRSGTLRGDAAAASAGGGVRRMSPTVQGQEDEVVAYSSPEAPYYGIISLTREKSADFHRQQQSSHGVTAYSMSNSQYHPRAPIMLAVSTPQTPPPVELPASADPGNSPLPLYYNNNWSRPIGLRRGVDYDFRPDKVGGNMI